MFQDEIGCSAVQSTLVDDRLSADIKIPLTNTVTRRLIVQRFSVIHVRFLFK